MAVEWSLPGTLFILQFSNLIQLLALKFGQIPKDSLSGSIGFQRGNISTLNSSSLKLVDKFTYLGSSVSSTETDINTSQAKAWTAIDRLSVIWKSDLTDNIKLSFFQAAVMLILLYGCTTWMLTKCMEKKLDGNYTRMLQAIQNKSWRRHPTKQQLYGHLPPITKTIKVRQTRHAGHCWRSKDKLISDVLWWISSHEQAKAGRPTRKYIQQLCANMGSSPEDLPEAMDDREGRWESIRDICADSDMMMMMMMMISISNFRLTIYYHFSYHFLISVYLMRFTYFYLFNGIEIP